ncbi:MAG: DMT family transporter [Rhodobacteraceae bacterium]|nr:DMT family transporter [Paracoccaceae bacterium]
MIASMAGFAVEDALVKATAHALPVGEVLMIFGAGGAVLFAAIARLNGERLYTPDVVSKPMRIRVLFEIIGRLFYVLAVTLTPLSSATVILQATPLVVVAGASMVFGERVGWRRWAAIFIGLIGVVIIIGPGTNSFSALSALAVIGMLGFAGRDLASRAAPITLSTSLLGLYGFLAVVVAGLFYSLWDGQGFLWPNLTISLYLALAILAGVSAYSCLMKAMRTGAVSAVTPFRYSRLLFGIALGVFVFGEQLSNATFIGAGLVVLSGLFTLWRGPARPAA